jgi:molybdopterin converting factor small subunit
VLVDLAHGQRTLSVVPAPASVAALLDRLAADYPVLVRRIRDETGAIRRFVNLYVEDTDIRHGDGPATALSDGSTVLILPSVAGG